MDSNKNSDALKGKAARMMENYRPGRYVFGTDCFDRIGGIVARNGRRAAVISSGSRQSWGAALRARIRSSLAGAGVEIIGEIIPGSLPNTPMDDVFRIADEVNARKPDCILAVGGGSNIDAVKGAAAYQALRDRHPALEEYFGTGKVSEMLAVEKRRLPPLVAVELISGSGSHLTKYSNITNTRLGQKMLIIDNALVPKEALFDYSLTVTMPRDLTMDGAFDGISHCLEVYMGYPESSADFSQLEDICLTGIEIIIRNIEDACNHPDERAPREALGLGTDLGGYSIMVGGTNGGHLNSFSFVDILPHGRACALMNPYYLAFFAPAIEKKILKIAEIFARTGLMDSSFRGKSGRELGDSAAKAMIGFSRKIKFPVTLSEVPGFTEGHIRKALAAAKNPALESKLRNMPVPLSADTVDKHMGSVLDAALHGDIGRIICL